MRVKKYPDGYPTGGQMDPPEPEDPCDMGELLREAVEAHCRASGASQADVARSAGLGPNNLSRALRDPNARPSTVRAVCRVLGIHLELVKDKEQGNHHEEDR